MWRAGLFFFRGNGKKGGGNMYAMKIVDQQFTVSEPSLLIDQTVALLQRIVGRNHGIHKFRALQVVKYDSISRIVIVKGKPPRFGLVKGYIEYENTSVSWYWLPWL